MTSGHSDAEDTVPSFEAPAYQAHEQWGPATGTYPSSEPLGPARARPLTDRRARAWSALAHLLMPVTGFIGPLLIWLWGRHRHRLLAANAREALNFAILYSLAVSISAGLTVVVLGYVLLPIFATLGAVFSVLGAVQANRGEEFRYPLNWQLVT